MKKKETSQERLKQIESELKIIKKCVDAKRFHDGLKGNGFEIVNAKLNFSEALDEAFKKQTFIDFKEFYFNKIKKSYFEKFGEVLFSPLPSDYEVIIAYRKKLRSDRGNLKTKKNKEYVTGCWLSKKLALKWNKKLALISDNYTTAFNQHVEKL